MNGLHLGATLVMALLVASSPSAGAQQQPLASVSGAPPATAAELRLEREAQAFDRRNAQVLLDHARVVAASGGPRDLLAAAILFRSLSLSLMDPAEAAAAPPQEARAWFAAATSVRPRDPLVALHEVDGAFFTGDRGDSADALAFLLAADPDNAAVHLRAMNVAEAAGNGALAQLHWERAATSARHDGYMLEMGGVLLEAVRGARMPPVSGELAAYLGQGLGLGRPASQDDLASITALSLWAAIALPHLGNVSARCAQAALAEGGEPRRRECLQLMRLLAADESALLMPSYGLKKMVELSPRGPSREQLAERLRDFHWLRQSVLRLMSGGPGTKELPSDYLEQVLTGGEIPAMRRMLELNGIGLQPPAGWLPEDKSIRALLAAPPAG